MSEQGSSLRPEVVATAVKFLHNSKVQQTPISNQREFLVKKGLNEPEIDAALLEAGASPLLPSPQGAPAHTSWLGALHSLVLVGGGTYALFRLFRTYILPTFFGIANPEAKRMAKMEEQLEEVSNNMKFVTDSMQQALTSLQQQQQTFNTALRAITDRRDPNQMATKADVMDIKKEMAILKSLLLSKNQFPAAPKVTELPTWQRPPRTAAVPVVEEASDDSGHSEDPAATATSTDC